MRRRDREILENDGIINIIEKCKVMRVGMCYVNIPYVVPLNFGYGYANNVFEFYFHSAKGGKKLDIILKNPSVCFEMDCDHQLITGDIACDYGYTYSSVIGNGIVEIVNDIEEKKLILSKLMRHQTEKIFVFNNEQAQTVAVCKIKVTSISAKRCNR